MKIIQLGNSLKQEPVKPWWIDKQIRCKRCRCIFELEEKDFNIKNHPDDRNEFRYNCPCCKRKLLIINPDSKIKYLFEDVFGKGGAFERIFGKNKS